MIQHLDIALIRESAKAVDAAGRPITGVSVQVPYRCRIEPLTATEAVALGKTITDREAVKVYAREWPDEVLGEIEALGKRWKQVGPTKSYRAGRMTAHKKAVLERL